MHLPVLILSIAVSCFTNAATPFRDSLLAQLRAMRPQGNLPAFITGGFLPHNPYVTTSPQVVTPAGRRTTTPSYVPQSTADEHSSTATGSDFLVNIGDLGIPLTEFALDIHNELRGTRGGNHIFSPLSISTVLNMLLLGTRGRTYTQIKRAINYPSGMSDEEIHMNYRDISDTLLNSGASGNVKVANGLFVQEDFTTKTSFLEDAEYYYNAEVMKQNFRYTYTSRANINSWVSQKTQGKINKLLTTPPSPDTKLIIANAVYFRGVWDMQFLPQFTKVGKFFPEEDLSVPVSMMHNHLDLPYKNVTSGQYEVIGLPYTEMEGGQRYGMFIFLPWATGTQALSDMEDKLTSREINTTINSLTSTTINLALPKFKDSNRSRLSRVLKSLGVTDLFDSSEADLRGIALPQADQEELRVSEAVHQASIEVTEEGTIASAATGISLSRDNTGKLFHVNRPFFYMIRETRTGIPLFMGRVTSLP